VSSLPNGWRWAPLQQLAAHEPNSITDGPFGSKLKTADYVDGGVRVIRLGNIGVGEFVDKDKAFISEAKFETLRKHEVFPGDLVVAALAEPVGRCTRVPDTLGRAVVKADCIRLKVRPETDSSYVMFALNSPDGRARAEKASHGIGRLRINMTEVRELEIPLPPLPEQRRIVAKLEALQARSRRARAALEAIPPLLNKFRQSVLAAAFRGDLTADWRAAHPDVEPASVLLERIRVERRRRWEDAELAKMRANWKAPKGDSWKGKYPEAKPVDTEGLPDLPAGWVWVRLEEIAEATDPNPSHRMPKYVTGGYPFVSTENFADRDRIDFTIGKQVAAQTLKEQTARYEIRQGSFAFSRIGTIGLTRPLPWKRDFCISHALCVVTPVTAELQVQYLRKVVSSEFILRQARSGVQSIGVPDLGMARIRAFALPLPPVAEQVVLVRCLSRAERIAAQTAEAISAGSASVESLGKSILAKAFRGDLSS